MRELLDKKGKKTPYNGTHRKKSSGKINGLYQPCNHTTNRKSRENRHSHLSFQISAAAASKLRVLLLLLLSKAKRHDIHVTASRVWRALPFADMASRRNVQYSKLSTDDEDEDDGSRSQRYDPRFDYSPKAFDKIPWKSIALALFLLCLGSLLLFLSLFIFTGHMGGETAQAFGLLVLGILSFLPGFYETRIAYYSWRGAEGYRFASIPNY